MPRAGGKGRRSSQPSARGGGGSEGPLAEPELLLAFSGRLLSSTDPQLMMDMAVDLVMDHFHVDLCKVLLLEADVAGGERFRLAAGRGWLEGRVGHATVGVGRSSQAGYTAATRQPVVVRDFARETRFEAPPLLVEHGVVSGMSVPMLAGEKVIGVMGCHHRAPRLFGEDDVRFLALVANHLALALEKASYYRGMLESEARYAGLVEHAIFGVYRSTVDGRLVAVNPALVEMLGYDSAEELQAVDMARALYRDPAERARLVERYRGADRFESLEVGWKRKDGSPITVRLTGRPVRDRDGALEGFETIVEDVSERRILEDRLREAQKMEALGHFARGVALEFSNVLTATLGHADVVLTALSPDHEHREDLEAITSAAARAVATNQKLLAFSRQGRVELRPLDLRGVVGRFVEAVRPLLGEGIELAERLEEGVPQVRADAGAVEQILMILLSNGQDAMPAGGTLLVELRNTWVDEAYSLMHPGVRRGRYAVVSVSDTGMGMHEQVKARIFEPFFTTKAPGEGRGLGMAMAYGLIQQHEGFVHVYSEPGQGATVKVYFPVTAPGEEPALPRGIETVLVAEDDAQVRRLTKRVLERFGYTVLVAADGEEALETLRARQGEVALLILDVVMPKLGGIEAHRALRERGPSPKVLFTSGYSAEEINARLALAGSEAAGSVLTKPWSVADLLVLVREALDR